MVWGWMWISVLVVAVTLELLTDQLVSIWFAPSAIVATVIDFFYRDIIVQSIVFLALSLVGILFLRRLLLGVRPHRKDATNIEAIVGEHCVVTQRIDTFAGVGLAKVKGQIWSARGLGENDVFEEGDVLQVVAIEGVKLICKKIKE